MSEMKTVTINGVTYDVHDPDALSGVDTTLSVEGKAADAAATGAALKNKAPAGCGYGDKMTYYDVQDGTFETVLDGILSGMEGYSAKQIQFYDPVGLYSNKFIGTLWKYTPNYATLDAVTYTGLKAIKRKVGGTWYPWEWENPPLEDGVEYRTTERYKGEVVFWKQTSGVLSKYLADGTNVGSISLPGLTMTGPIKMGSKRISGLPEATSATEPLTQAFMNNSMGYIRFDTNTTFDIPVTSRAVTLITLQLNKQLGYCICAVYHVNNTIKDITVLYGTYTPTVEVVTDDDGAYYLRITCDTNYSYGWYIGQPPHRSF